MAHSSRDERKVEVVGILGIGLDGTDGHRRLTTGENFVLIGGSEETHERLVDAAVHVNAALRHRGKRLQDASPDELIELFEQISD